MDKYLVHYEITEDRIVLNRDKAPDGLNSINQLVEETKKRSDDIVSEDFAVPLLTRNISVIPDLIAKVTCGLCFNIATIPRNPVECSSCHEQVMCKACEVKI